MGGIAINPFDPDHVLFTTGYGLWGCTNATEADTGRPTRWVFMNAGLEETVPLALLSPAEGAHLLSGLGDIDGFRHDDLSASPAQGTFSGPRFSNTESLSVAWRNPQIIARTGTGRGGSVRAALSRDGGSDWEPLGSEPPGSSGAGSIALSADGKIIVWTPRRGEAHYTLDLGAHWTRCEGMSAGLAVVADTVNAAKFYACDPRAGTLLVSTNGAASFAPATSALPRIEGYGSRFGDGTGAALSVAPGVDGGVWLAFRSQGLYRSVDGGAGMEKLGSVQEAHSVGFGKAAPGKN